jgi:hypothetical protein
LELGGFHGIHPYSLDIYLTVEVCDNDVEQIDLLVGSLAESPLPSGFGFSDTFFRIFVLMARRRLESDRFFTDDSTPEFVVSSSNVDIGVRCSKRRNSLYLKEYSHTIIFTNKLTYYNIQRLTNSRFTNILKHA